MNKLQRERLLAKIEELMWVSEQVPVGHEHITDMIEKRIEMLKKSLLHKVN